MKKIGFFTKFITSTAICALFASSISAMSAVGNVEVPRGTPTIDGKISDGEWDGAGVVKAARILGRPLPGKVAGVELGERMLAVCAARGDGVYFLGAKPGVAEEAAKRMTEKYPGLRIVGTHDG